MFEGHPVKRLLERWSVELPGARWFVVGGAVRDALLDRPVRDIDLLVAAVPFDEVLAFLKARGAVDVVGRAFGVLKFVSREDGQTLDIALPRRERPSGTGGYRDVETASDPFMPIEEDLGRRDFTVNAIAWEAATDRLIDPYEGRKDAAERLLRAVGDPEARFAEDYTRVLRALRFAAQLGFDIEQETWKALRASALRMNDIRGGLRVVPMELVARELLKGFAADPVRTAELWQEAGLVAELLPELDAWPERVRNASQRLEQADMVRIIGNRGVPARLLFGWSIAHLGPESAGALAQRLRLASAGVDVDETLVRRLASGGEIALYKEAGLKPLLEGERVMRVLGLHTGPELGRALDALLEAQAKGLVQDAPEAEAYLLKSWKGMTS